MYSFKNFRESLEDHMSYYKPILIAANSFSRDIEKFTHKYVLSHKYRLIVSLDGVDQILAHATFAKIHSDNWCMYW